MPAVKTSVQGTIQMCSLFCAPTPPCRTQRAQGRARAIVCASVRANPALRFEARSSFPSSTAPVHSKAHTKALYERCPLSPA